MNSINFMGRTNINVDYSKDSQSSRACKFLYKSGNERKLAPGKYFVNIPCGDFFVAVKNKNIGLVKYFANQRLTPKMINAFREQVENLASGAKDNLTALVVGGTCGEALENIAEVVCDKDNIDTTLLIGEQCDHFLLNSKRSTDFDVTLDDAPEKMFDVVERDDGIDA